MSSSYRPGAKISESTMHLPVVFPRGVLQAAACLDVPLEVSRSMVIGSVGYIPNISHI